MRIRSLLFCLLLSLFVAISINAQSYEYFTAFEGAPAAKAKAVELNLSGAKLVFIGAYYTFFGGPPYNTQSCLKGKAHNWLYIFSYSNDEKFSLISITKKQNKFVAYVPIDLSVDSLLEYDFDFYFNKIESLPDSLKDSDTEFIVDSLIHLKRTILPDSCLNRIGLGAAENINGYGYNFNDKFIWRVDEQYLVDNGFGGSQQEWGVLYISAITGEYQGGVFSVNVNDSKSEEKDFSVTPNPSSDFINIVPYTKQIQIFNIYGNKLLESEYKDRIDVSGFPAGVYFLKAGSKVYKFIKM